MRKIRYLIRLLGAFLGRFKGVILLSVLAGVVFFVILRVLGPSIFSFSGDKYGIIGRYRTDELPEEVTGLISEGLTKVNEDGSISPALAKKWETPDRGKTWIFTLDETKKWQDGKAITASAINYQFSDVEIERPDEKTIIFKLENPFSPLPYVVSRPIFKKGLLGTGEWRVNKAIVRVGYIQELRLTNQGGAKKTIKFFPTEERGILGYKLGEINKLSGIFNAKAFENWKTSEVTEESNPRRYVAIFFNTQDKFLGEKNLRQALSYAIDKDQFPYPRALGPISPDSWAHNPQVKPYIFDLTRAKELIDDLPDEIKENLTVNLGTTPVLLPQAETIAQNWRDAGVNTNVQVTSGLPSEYQAYLAIIDIPQDPDQYSLWHSTQQGTNISRYQSPRIDKLLEDGRVQNNTEERKKIYLDFQRFLLEDAPAAFLYHPSSYTVTRK